jgi:hypothetical protein
MVSAAGPATNLRTDAQSHGGIRMNRLFSVLACALLLAPAAAGAQALPLDVDIAANSATVRVGNPSAPLADVQLDFDEARGLSQAALGLSARSLSPTAPNLVARLGSTQVSIANGLPVLFAVAPPTLGGLAFDRRVHVEVHTHLLTYSTGSRYRLFKSPAGGAFRDITTSVEPGSVRTRGTTGGFSDFVVVLDLRPTDVVVDQKIQWLRDQLATLPGSESALLHDRLDQVELALATDDFAAAMVAIEKARVRVANRAGTQIPETWSANGSTVNSAGELISGLDTLAFSIGFLRDFGP